MDYPFRYNPVKRTFFEKKNKFLSELLFACYRSKRYQKLGLGDDYMIKQYCNYKKAKPDYINEIKYVGINVKNIIFYDLLRIEEAKIFKKQISKIASKLSPGFFQENYKKAFDNSFDGIDNDYDTISYGTSYTGSILERSETDLIKYISIGYVKGSESSIIVKYKVYPTERFNQLLIKCLEADTTTECEVEDVSLKHFFLKSKKYNSGIKFKELDDKYWTNKLLDEIGYQLKSEILKGLKVGVFMRKKQKIFPKITTFEYEQNKFVKYEVQLYRVLSSGFRNGYSSSDAIFVIDEHDYREKSNYEISILMTKRTHEELDNGFNSIDRVSNEYANIILPRLALMNFAYLQKDAIVNFRRNIFAYLQKNRSSLFLSKLISLKNGLTLKIIDFERFCKDLTGQNGISKRRLSQDGIIPEALRKCHTKDCSKKHDFKSELFADCEYSEKDIKKSYEELSSLFQTISEDNHSRSNMRLQRLLFLLAILGIILTIYGTNAEWVNSWIKYSLNKIGWSIPHVKD